MSFRQWIQGSCPPALRLDGKVAFKNGHYSQVKKIGMILRGEIEQSIADAWGAAFKAASGYNRMMSKIKNRKGDPNNDYWDLWLAKHLKQSGWDRSKAGANPAYEARLTAALKRAFDRDDLALFKMLAKPVAKPFKNVFPGSIEQFLLANWLNSDQSVPSLALCTHEVRDAIAAHVLHDDGVDVRDHVRRLKLKSVAFFQLDGTRKSGRAPAPGKLFAVIESPLIVRHVSIAGSRLLVF